MSIDKKYFTKLEEKEMILSVSRRTDIPGCYPEWFMNRLRDKYVMTRNPMNFHQVSQINLSPDFIECIVFWTKNAVPFMDYLEELNRMGYMYMFQYTITPYDNTLEKNISDKSDIIKNVLELSEKIEKKRIVWRYDPILLNDTYTVNRHIELFEEMCSLLYTAVNHVVISFIDLYQKNRGYAVPFPARTRPFLSRISPRSACVVETLTLSVEVRFRKIMESSQTNLYPSSSFRKSASFSKLIVPATVSKEVW